MKGIKRLLFMLVCVCSLTGLMGCDSIIESDLEGSWYGNFAMYLSDGPYSEKAYETRIFFDSDGGGTQWDYYKSYGTDVNTFTWDVRDGDIIMRYDHGGTMSDQDVVIKHYSINYDDGYKYWTGSINGENFRMYQDEQYYRDEYAKKKGIIVPEK